MQYDAITLDTNIFRHNGFYLEGGMLGQFSQFREGSAQFVLSEIVVLEVRKYLKIEAIEATDNLGRAIKKSSKNGLLSAKSTEQLNAIHEGALSPEDAVEERFKAFSENTGAEIVPADQTEIKELIKRYFTSSAPFEASGKKKNEFPDAIALLSLESWAKTNNKKVLAISNDGGWADFAKDSEWIDVEKNLAPALEKLQQHTEKAEIFVGSILADMDAGKNPELRQQVVDAMADAVSAMDVYAEADAACHVEAEQVCMSYEDVSFLRFREEYEFTMVQTGKDKIVANVGVSIKAKAEAEFSFAVWDSIDREYVPMGSNSAEREVEFDAAALITIEGDFTGDSAEVEILEVELIDAIDSVDFGEVEMDYGEDYYE